MLVDMLTWAGRTAVSGMVVGRQVRSWTQRLPSSTTLTMHHFTTVCKPATRNRQTSSWWLGAHRPGSSNIAECPTKSTTSKCLTRTKHTSGMALEALG